jgi:hypothetical protein
MPSSADVLANGASCASALRRTMGGLGSGTGHEPDREDMVDHRPLRRDDLGTSGQVEARLVIRLLGEVAVSLDGSPLLDLTTLRLQRLLGRLALTPNAGLRRDRLAYQLWRDSTEPQARTIRSRRSGAG